MLNEGHIFTIKTKDESNVFDVTNSSSGIVITGLNVLRDQIKEKDFVFVVFGGDKPKGWVPGLVALAHVSKEPFVDALDQGKNFRIEIDIDLFFQPSIKRGELITFPDTFDTIGIAPITKWEPNQAITSVPLKNAIGLLQALCGLRPTLLPRIKDILGAAFTLIDIPVRRFSVGFSALDDASTIQPEMQECIVTEEEITLRDEFQNWMVEVAGKSPKTAKDTARTYVPTISDEYQEPLNHIWHGLREALYGVPAPSRVYQLTSFAELEQWYGGLSKVFGKTYQDEGFEVTRFRACWDWAHSRKNHHSVSAGWALFTAFMKWREEHVPTPSPQDHNKSGTFDVLECALRLFNQCRFGDKWQKKVIRDSYLTIYEFGKTSSAELAALPIDRFKLEVMDKVWSFANGGVRKWGQLTDDERLAYQRSVAGMREKLQPFDAYFPPSTQCPRGMGVGVVTELLMRFYPTCCCSYNKDLIWDALVTLHYHPIAA